MANSFHQVMTHFNLYGILIIKNLKEVDYHSGVRIKSIPAFKISKLISLEYFKLPNRSVFYKVIFGLFFSF